MKPTVELIKPARLNKLGTVFKKGVETPVDVNTALQLEADGRFIVRGLGNRSVAAMKNSKPQGKELLRKIINAMNDLDEDDDANFDRNGKASVLALSGVLGFPVLPDERDKALEMAAKGARDIAARAAEAESTIEEADDEADESAEQPEGDEAENETVNNAPPPVRRSFGKQAAAPQQPKVPV